MRFLLSALRGTPKFAFCNWEIKRSHSCAMFFDTVFFSQWDSLVKLNVCRCLFLYPTSVYSQTADARRPKHYTSAKDLHDEMHIPRNMRFEYRIIFLPGVCSTNESSFWKYRRENCVMIMCSHNQKTLYNMCSSIVRCVVTNRLTYGRRQ